MREIRLDCTGTLSNVVILYSWVIPHQDNMTYFIQNGTLRLNKDGSLEILSVQSRDSGIYLCLAVDTVRMINETREVNLIVVSRNLRTEPFCKGYTTLLSCAITLISTVMYLYLNPCRCSCCKVPPKISSFGEDRQSLAFIFGVSPTASLNLMQQANKQQVQP